MMLSIKILFTNIDNNFLQFLTTESGVWVAGYQWTIFAIHIMTWHTSSINSWLRRDVVRRALGNILTLKAPNKCRPTAWSSLADRMHQLNHLPSWAITFWAERVHCVHARPGHSGNGECQSLVNSNDTVQVFMSAVRSILEHACVAWHTCLTAEQSEKLQSIQRWAMALSPQTCHTGKR